MQSKLTQLKTLLNEIHDINSSAALLAWDQQTYMPEGGTEGRSYQLSTLETLAHLKFTSAEVGNLLEELLPYADQIDPDSDDARLIKVTHRHFQKSTRVPTELVAEFAQTSARAHPVWQQARAENNFALFQPVLERIFELRRRYAALFAPYDHIYDPLLDDYEPGLKTADVQAIFQALRPQQVALIQAISRQTPPEDAFIHQHYDEQKQWDFGVDVITRFGYDWTRGRQDRAPHPFTQGFGIDDVRITTRFPENNGVSGLFSTMHEAGHALYELGVDHALARLPLAHGASLALHESQSRMWENLVGRSLPFWEYFYPRMQTYFPAQLGKINLDQFYKAINLVKPTFIRVEADEATYNLHIMLRLEIEIALIEGSLEVRDLPEAWNMRMKDYLGVTPPTDTLGVLQDVHWSMGLIGYFSTYALGNLISAQLWESIHRDIPDLEDQIRTAEFSSLLGWLRENLHRHGAKFEPQEMVQRITASKIDPQPYMRYLQTKYGAIYGL
ncbi:MAG: carboxypeptidase M32 [Anaerolineales bacterium]|nr:carboxypeptidase M32 [Anaerolineales bacterium]